MGRRIAPAFLLVVLWAWAATPAQAALGEIYTDYRQTGLVNGCQRSPAELREALTSIPADIQAYDPGYAEALNAALAERGAGCEGEEEVDHIPTGAEEAVDGSPSPRPPLIAAAPAPAGEEEASGSVALILAVAFGAGLIAVMTLAAPAPRRRDSSSRWGRMRGRLSDVLFVARRRLRG